jgi:hypothetical protein
MADKEPDAQAGQASIAEMAERLAKLAALQQQIVATSKKLFDQNKSMYLADFYVMGALRRILALAKGFRSQIADRNFLCAAPLVRMQLDTALRVYALSLVSNRDDVAKQLLDGVPLSKLKDAKGQKLRDAYLVDQLSETYAWVKPLYAETSGFVHLSERHFFTSIAKTNDEEQVVHLSITSEDDGRSEADYYEVVDAFHESTRLAGTVIAGYLLARTKMAGS